MLDLEPHIPTTALQKINANPVVKFGGGGLSLFGFFGSIALGVWTNVPPLLLVGIGSAFFLMFLFFLFLHVWNNQRGNFEGNNSLKLLSSPVSKQKEAGEKKPVVPTVSVEPPYRPHIRVVNNYFKGSASLDRVGFKTAKGEPTHDIFFIHFENTTTVPPRKIGEPENVSARIAYENEYGAMINTPVNLACWLDNDSPYVNFPLNTPRRLIFGAMQTDLSNERRHEMQLYGYTPEGRPDKITHLGNGPLKTRLKVDLIVENHSEWTHHFEFDFQMFSEGAIGLDLIKVGSRKIPLKPESLERLLYKREQLQRLVSEAKSRSSAGKPGSTFDEQVGQFLYDYFDSTEIERFKVRGVDALEEILGKVIEQQSKYLT